MNHVILPELGESIEKATVACWHAGPGQKVAADDEIVEVVTDKATFNVPAGHEGVIKEILVEEGKEVPIGTKLAAIE